MAFWAFVAAATSVVSHFQGKKDRKKARGEEAKVTGQRLQQEAFEIGRVERKRAADERSLLTAGGISSKSGSAQATERDTMREAAYQQESILAGLPAGQKWRNPLASFRGANTPKKKSAIFGALRNLGMGREIAGSAGALANRVYGNRFEDQQEDDSVSI
jgi:hypothetical protein